MKNKTKSSNSRLEREVKKLTGEMMQKAGMMTNNQITVGMKYGFYYPYFNKIKRNEESVDKLFNFFINSLVNTYMDKMVIAEVDDSEFMSDMSIDEEISVMRSSKYYIQERMKKVSEFYPNGGYRTRVQSEKHSLALYTVGTDERNTLAIFLYYNDEIEKYSSLYFIGIFDQNQISMVSPNRSPIRHYTGTALYYSIKDKRAKEQCRRESEYVVNTVISPTILNWLAILLENEPCDPHETDNMDYPKYGKQEIGLIKNAMKYCEDVTCHTVYGMRRYDIEDYQIQEFNEWNKNIPIQLGEYVNLSKYPLIDFDEKENKFVSSYCKKMKFFSDDNINCHFDIRKYLEEPTYGEVLRFNYKIDSDDEILIDKFEILFIYQWNKEKDLSRFHIIEKVSGNLYIDLSMDYNNLEEFDIFEGFISSRIDIVLTDHSQIPNEYNEVKKRSGLLNFNAVDMLSSLKLFLSDMITIHDRPKRTKMLKCTKQNENTKRKSFNKKNNRRKNSDDDSNVIIIRVLKSATEAKKIIEDQETQSDDLKSRKAAEYTIEEWTTAGHYRHYKSGKVIWINEHFNHRNLPLTEKEVHLKL